MSIKEYSLNNYNRPIDVFVHWRDSGVLWLNASYQRGDVWGPIRQRNLIRSLIQGVPIPSLIINDRLHAEWRDSAVMAVIDGKQRITAVLRFLDSELAVPADWFGDGGDSTSDGIEPGMVLFKDLSKRDRRHFVNSPMACIEGRLPTIEDEIELFELVNYGGVPQGESDLPESDDQ